MLVQEVPAAVYLFSVQAYHEIQVSRCGGQRSVHGCRVSGLGSVQDLPCAKGFASRRAYQHVWLLLAQQRGGLLPFRLPAEIQWQTVGKVYDREVRNRERGASTCPL